MKDRQSHRGMVLIFALWVLGILTILAVGVAGGIRQNIFLVARLDVLLTDVNNSLSFIVHPCHRDYL